MGKLELPKSFIIKEIIRYEEDMYLLEVKAECCNGWDFTWRSLFIRSDIKALSEILRLEISNQTKIVEDLLLNMISYGKPPKINLKEITGNDLTLMNSEIIMKNFCSEENINSINDLPQLVDVFPIIKTEKLEKYLHIEKEFSKDILEKTFADFQKTFALVDRGYPVETASAILFTDNPIASMIYNKIKAQLLPEESREIAEKKEEAICERTKLKQLVLAGLPF